MAEPTRRAVPLTEALLALGFLLLLLAAALTVAVPELTKQPESERPAATDGPTATPPPP